MPISQCPNEIATVWSGYGSMSNKRPEGRGGGQWLSLHKIAHAKYVYHIKSMHTNTQQPYQMQPMLPFYFYISDTHTHTHADKPVRICVHMHTCKTNVETTTEDKKKSLKIRCAILANQCRSDNDFFFLVDVISISHRPQWIWYPVSSTATVNDTFWTTWTQATTNVTCIFVDVFRLITKAFDKSAIALNIHTKILSISINVIVKRFLNYRFFPS